MDNRVKTHNIMMHIMRPILEPKNSTPPPTTTQITKIIPPPIGEITIKYASKPTNGPIALEEATFIIPVCIESDDRLMNFKTTYQYLRKTLNTNIIIYECSVEPIIHKLIADDVTYIFEKNDSPYYHRTRHLNYMLNMVKTPITVNYDIDVLLKPLTYKLCKDMIMSGHDILYPFQFGNFQKQIVYPGRDKILAGKSLDELSGRDYGSESCLSYYGHCQFFNTKSYKKYGWENEHFISYGPEDVERFHRFYLLSDRIDHLNGHHVYHLEHSRSSNSSNSNPYYIQNYNLLQRIKNMNKSELKNYYHSADYLKKYE